jgi:hypothetical protein
VIFSVVLDPSCVTSCSLSPSCFLLCTCCLFLCLSQILASIFGKSTAREICAKADTTSSSSSSSSSKTKATPSILREKVVTETAKYAGQVVQVKRKVQTLSSDETSTSSSSSKKVTTTSLDSALSAINGPTKLNTVTKSSMDWENYKDESGMGDDLEQAAKNGFLSKKEFLERCDVRRFEKELETRQQEKKK